MGQVPSSIYSFHIGGKDTFLDVFHYLPRSDKEKEAGELVAVIEFLDNPGAEDALTHIIFQTLRDTFYGSSKKDSFDRFEHALREVNNVITNEGNKREGGSLGRISACVAVLQGKMIHFTQSGEGAAYVLRNNKLSLITEKEEAEAHGDTFINISSGELDNGDQLFFTTYNILTDVNKTGIKEIFAKEGGTEKAVKSLKGLLKEAKVSSVATLCLFMGEVTAQEVMDATKVRVEHEKSKKKMALEGFLPKAIDFCKDCAMKAKKMISKTGIKIPKNKKFMENKRYVLVGIVGAIVVLIVILVVRSIANLDNARVSEYEKLLRETRSNLSIAEQRFLIGEKDDAQEFLDIAEQQVQEILTTGYFRQEASQILGDIEKYRDDFDSIFRVEEPYIVADISEKGVDIESLGLVHTKDDKNYVYEYNLLYETLLEKVQDPLVIDEDEVIVAAWEFEDNNSVIFLAQSGQVIEFKDGAFTRMTTDDPKWKSGIEVKTYSQFVYILDTTEGKIWKYPRLRSRYGISTAWNLEGDLRSAISFAIDGDIYVLFKDGSIKKFRKGEEQPYNVRTQPDIIPTNPTKLYTHPELVNLYILDPENKRVVVYGKDKNGIADYKRQFLFEGLGDMRDIYVDNLEQKIFVLTKDKIYGADL
jgi:serine/threonine protein phosphatase PrpC